MASPAFLSVIARGVVVIVRMNSIFVLLVACSFGSTVLAADAADRGVIARDAFVKQNPKARFYESGDRITRVYGAAMSEGASAEESATHFVRRHAEMLGVKMGDLSETGPLADGRHTQGVMFDPATGQYKFTLVYYTQSRGGIPVYGSDLRLLVRNEPGYPLVLVANALRELDDFEVGPLAAGDSNKGIDAVKAKRPELTRFSQPEMVIWAGIEDMQVSPRLAYRFVADDVVGNRDVESKWDVLTDAVTGVILHEEGLILDADVEGSVSGVATVGSAAAFCAEEAATPLPYLNVTSGASSVVADAFGEFVLTGLSDETSSVASSLDGRWFFITTDVGEISALSEDVLPPGPVDFLHNADNDSDDVLSQMNGYLHANIVRDYVLSFNPDYPVIANQEDFRVRVNWSGGICPCNAQYTGDMIRFCRQSGSCPNMAFSAIVHHEYGHHLVSTAGSGQGAYGEGSGDVMGVLIMDEPETGIGFQGSCNSGLRTADNNRQFPCNGPIHTCGTLLSGSVWDTRNALLATHPDDYREILSNLAINAMLLHTGSSVTPQITIDYLTLDDDDETIDNGSPHYLEIAEGFGLHNMDAPPLALLAFAYPEGRPAMADPTAGATVRVAIEPVTGVLDATVSPTLNLSVNGGPFEAIDMVDVGEGVYEGTLPGSECFDTIRWFVGATAEFGGLATSPSSAPSNVFETVVATSVNTESSFDFEVDPGFGVLTSATEGTWEIGDPVGCNRGDPPADFDGSGQCWLTENDEFGCNSDVDDGSTTLITTAFDMSELAAVYKVSYARWYSNTEGDSPNSDVFVVDISNDDGVSWTNLETVGPAGPEADGGWFEVEHRVDSVISPTDQVRLRFLASDAAPGSVVEAAVDALRVEKLVCAVDNVSPAIVHGGLTNPFSGYIDPRMESTDGVNSDLGFLELVVQFTEPVTRMGGGNLENTSFSVVATGGAEMSVVSVDASENPLVRLTLSEPIQPGEWVTVIAEVQDEAGNEIQSFGDLGADFDEPDRVDVAFLPGDIDQSGDVTPLDLFTFRQFLTGVTTPPSGSLVDFVDTNRDGEVTPLDLFTYRQLINGAGNATQAWSGASLDSDRP